METWEIHLLDRHLQMWLDQDELNEVWSSGEPAQTIAAQLATQDFAFFCFYYLPHYFRDPPATVHWEAFDEIQYALSHGEGIKLAISLPRGFGKSTIASVAAPLWCVIGADDPRIRGKRRKPRRHYVWIIKDSFDQSKLELRSIKDEIEDNEKIRRDFGNLIGNTWAKAELVTANGVRTDALGTGQKARGRHHGPYRPDFVVGDDLENLKTVRSPTQRAEVQRWWAATVDKAIDPKTAVVVNIGTMIHHDCLQKRRSLTPGVRSKVYKALLREADNQTLWNEWEFLVTNLDDPDREKTARRFYIRNKIEMDRGAEVTWPERFSYYVLQLMRLGEKKVKGRALKTFSAEMQNEPIDPEDKLFKRISFFHIEHEGRYTYLVPDGAGQRVTLRHCQLFGALDPSLGETHQGSFSAIVEILLAPNGRMFCIHADIARRHPDRLIDAIRQRCLHWASLKMFYNAFGIETVQFQKLFASSAGKDLLAAGIRLPIVEIGSQANKFARIDTLQPDLHNGYLLLFKEPHSELPIELETLYDQLDEYPMGDFLDGPDALEMARSLAARPQGHGHRLPVDAISIGDPFSNRVATNDLEGVTLSVADPFM